MSNNVCVFSFGLGHERNLDTSKHTKNDRKQAQKFAFIIKFPTVVIAAALVNVQFVCNVHVGCLCKRAKYITTSATTHILLIKFSRLLYLWYASEF